MGIPNFDNEELKYTQYNAGFLREPLLRRGLAIASLRQFPYELGVRFCFGVLGPWNQLPEYFRRFYCLDELIKSGMIPPA